MLNDVKYSVVIPYKPIEKGSSCYIYCTNISINFTIHIFTKIKPKSFPF